MSLARDAQTIITLADLSLFPRWGIKGHGASGLLNSKGCKLPMGSNQSALQDDRSIISQLSPTEFLILADLKYAGSEVNGYYNDIPAAGLSHVYPVSRIDSHGWLLLRGNVAPQVLAKLCGIDFSFPHFENMRVAQTSVARLSTIVIRNDVVNAPAYSLLSDSASTEYLWDCILDAAGEFGDEITTARTDNWSF